MVREPPTSTCVRSSAASDVYKRQALAGGGLICRGGFHPEPTDGVPEPGGRLVITGVTSGARASMNLSILQGRPVTLMGSGGRSQRTFVDMMKVVNHGALHGIVSKVFPLDQVAEAHRTMEARDFFGKLVIES